jgi:plastocyanin
VTTAAKRLPRCAGAALAVCVAAAALGAGSAGASDGPAVSILDTGFRPAVVTIKQWQVVTWTNDGKEKHNVTSDSGSTLASGDLEPGAAYGNLFMQAGTFAYHDSLHPKLHGRVVVVAAPKPASTGPAPPSGKEPPGFKPKPGITQQAAPTSGSGGTRTDWGAVAVGAAALAVILAAAGLVLSRRRRARG